MLENFVDHVLSPVENRQATFFQETEALAQVLLHQDDLIASLTQELAETRTLANNVSLCLIRALDQLDAKDIILSQVGTQFQSLQVESHEKKFAYVSILSQSL
jgi:hypothetical protein